MNVWTIFGQVFGTSVGVLTLGTLLDHILEHVRNRILGKLLKCWARPVQDIHAYERYDVHTDGLEHPHAFLGTLATGGNSASVCQEARASDAPGQAQDHRHLCLCLAALLAFFVFASSFAFVCAFAFVCFLCFCFLEFAFKFACSGVLC